MEYYEFDEFRARILRFSPDQYQKSCRIFLWYLSNRLEIILETMGLAQNGCYQWVHWQALARSSNWKDRIYDDLLSAGPDENSFTRKLIFKSEKDTLISWTQTVSIQSIRLELRFLWVSKVKLDHCQLGWIEHGRSLTNGPGWRTPFKLGCKS